MQLLSVTVLDMDKKQEPILKYQCKRTISNINYYRDILTIVYKHIYKKNVMVILIHKDISIKIKESEL